MTKKTKIILIVSSIVTLGTIGGIIAYNKRKKKKLQAAEEDKSSKTEDDTPLPEPTPKAPDKLELVEKYTGTKRENDFVRYYFDDKKYYTMFYNNGRYAIVTTGKSGYIQKGNYSDGGKTLIATDGKNKGKTFTSSSIERNLKSAIK